MYNVSGICDAENIPNVTEDEPPPAPLLRVEDPVPDWPEPPPPPPPITRILTILVLLGFCQICQELPPPLV